MIALIFYLAYPRFLQIISQCILDVQEIAHAVSSQKLASQTDYKAEYVGEMLGKAPADLANSYPEYEHKKKVSKLASKVSVTLSSVHMSNKGGQKGLL